MISTIWLWMSPWSELVGPVIMLSMLLAELFAMLLSKVSLRPIALSKVSEQILVPVSTVSARIVVAVSKVLA